MATLQIARVTGTSPAVPTLKIARVTGTGTASAARKLRIARVSGTGSAAVVVQPIADLPITEPHTVVNITATLAAPPTGSVTWVWTHESGPAPLSMSDTGDTVTFTTPDVMPGSPATTTIGVTATNGGVTSPKELVSIPVYPQTEWYWNGTAWTGVEQRPVAVP